MIINLALALLGEVLRNARISVSNARATSRRKRLQRAIIWQERNEYAYPFTQEEKYAMVHKHVDQTLNDFLAPQYEQDMEEPPRLTAIELIDEFQRVATLAREMGIPFIVGVQAPGYSRIYMASNITPPQTDTQIMCAYHDLSR